MTKTIKTLGEFREQTKDFPDETSLEVLHSFIAGSPCSVTIYETRPFYIQEESPNHATRSLVICKELKEEDTENETK